jgi:hypothetical protein
MPTKYSAETVLTDIEKIVRVWADNPTFTLGEVTLQNVQAKIAEARQKIDQLEDLRMQSTTLTNSLNERVSELAAIRTRGLSGFRAVFGPNSTQYKLAGGTPSSERHRPASKKGGSGKS